MVHIHNQDLFFHSGQCNSEIAGDTRFSDPTLIIADTDYYSAPSHLRFLSFWLTQAGDYCLRLCRNMLLLH
jgi:hypothetical protein